MNLDLSLDSIPSLIKMNSIYFFNILKNSFSYFISLDWFFRFLQEPIFIPNNWITNLKEIYYLQNPKNFLFNYNTPFFPITNYEYSILLKSILTSLFYWLPNSAIHFLMIRRLIVQGLPSGIASACGTFCAQLLLLITVLFGWRFLLFNWMQFESWNYLCTLFLIGLLTYKLSQSPIKRIRSNNYYALWRIFSINFLLVIFENYGLFPYISGFNVFDHLSYLQLNNYKTQIIYIIGFSLGSLIWIILFGQLILLISQKIVNKFIKSYSLWIQRVNFVCLTLILSFAIASLPYYGFEYLFQKPFQLAEQTIFKPKLQLKTDITDVSKGRLGEYSAHSSIDTDIAPYDRGRYRTGNEVELTFEDMNFQGEYIWRSRTDRLASGSAGIVNQFMAKFLPQTVKETLTPTPSTSLHTIELMDPSLEFYETEPKFESLLIRFRNDYNSEVMDSTLGENLMELEQFSAFSELVKYGFDSFASLEDIESDEFEEELGKKIKLKYYKNPIYQLILNLDISQFLNRQPSLYTFSIQQQKILFERKKILTNYYNSVRDYSYLPYTSIFKYLFGNSKTYANRVYNQQYKGTLKILRRLFLIDTQLKPSTMPLKYDQLLYQPKSLSIHHEELNGIKNKIKNITENKNLPIYLGWDVSQKKFIITNRYLTQENIFLFSQLINKTDINKEGITLINFITWPLNQFNLEQKHNSKFMFYRVDQAQSELQKDLFEYTELGDYETHLIYDTLPAIIKRVDLRNKDKSNISLKSDYNCAFQNND
uniref:Ycf1 n=1 Tax=Pedobesia claviformis TaxID=2364088 RepID=A0A386B0Q7_9CHLO|nr:hypothetical protein Ycf1 [Pedobesia claviformis]AYC65270.1 hypothetical protein Ycf1 [Pedobesia claviformis]